MIWHKEIVDSFTACQPAHFDVAQSSSMPDANKTSTSFPSSHRYGDSIQSEPPAKSRSFSCDAASEDYLPSTSTAFTEALDTFEPAHFNHHANIAELSHAHKAHTSFKGAKSEEAVCLAGLFSRAVDAGKTGQTVSIPGRLKVKDWPNFMANKQRNTVRSTCVLTHLYDQLQARRVIEAREGIWRGTRVELDKAFQCKTKTIEAKELRRKLVSWATELLVNFKRRCRERQAGSSSPHQQPVHKGKGGEYHWLGPLQEECRFFLCNKIDELYSVWCASSFKDQVRDTEDGAVVSVASAIHSVSALIRLPPQQLYLAKEVAASWYEAGYLSAMNARERKMSVWIQMSFVWRCGAFPLLLIIKHENGVWPVRDHSISNHVPSSGTCTSTSSSQEDPLEDYERPPLLLYLEKTQHLL